MRNHEIDTVMHFAAQVSFDFRFFCNIHQLNAPRQSHVDASFGNPLAHTEVILYLYAVWRYISCSSWRGILTESVLSRVNFLAKFRLGFRPHSISALTRSARSTDQCAWDAYAARVREAARHPPLHPRLHRRGATASRCEPWRLTCHRSRTSLS